jgi:PAS domain S-box-containing protein
MGALMRSIDWARTPLGPIESWPQSLRTSVSICLSSRFPILVWWGPELVMLYNDAYRPILGAAKHPQAMGRGGREVWPETWPILGPMLEGVLTQGEATWSDDQLLLLDRNGFLEECYFTFSYSPIRDESGRVGGVFCAVTETTWRVLGERRLQTLRESQEALRASEAKFAAAFDQGPLALTITSLDDGRLVDVNESFVSLSGYTQEEAVGRTPDELGLWVEPGMRVERFARMRMGERVPNVEARFRMKSGEERTGVISSTIIEVDSRPCVLSSVIDITVRKEAEEKLREANQRKDEFLAMLAHELRNPLAPIRNAAQVLKLVGPQDANQQWAREVIERQTKHLTHLVDDLLDVSRITRGKVTLVREPLDLATIIHRAIETSRPLIESSRHQLTVVLPPETVRLDGDVTRLVQVVGNLLNNAAKFTEEGGQIRIEAAREGAEAVIRVRDNGLGLPADLLPHVFDLFTQADRSLDRSQGGLGIGLTLVRRLVEMHGGRVEAQSDGPGRGSEFIVRLPAAVADNSTGSDAAVGESARSAPRALKILLVEDNVDSAEMMSFLLELNGHEVRTAHDGAEALEAARVFEPQVVLCDIGLPGMNGYEVAARLREQPALKQTSLIALTGYGQEDARLRSKAAGFDYHLVKPVEPDALNALLNLIRADRVGR